jgi:glutamine amidotransferase
MKKRVGIIDYGLGNLHSVKNAIVHLGFDAFCAKTPEEMKEATHWILPGVGAYEDGMKGLKASGFDLAIQEHAKEEKPILGICLGAQLMMEYSEEFGCHQGLGLIRGGVKKIPGEAPKIPHVSWQAIFPSEGISWEGTPLQTTPKGTWVYFVHSYHVVPQQAQNLMAVSQYGGAKIHAVVKEGKSVGMQFHPEKSGRDGLEMLKQFVAL